MVRPYLPESDWLDNLLDYDYTDSDYDCEDDE